MRHNQIWEQGKTKRLAAITLACTLLAVGLASATNTSAWSESNYDEWIEAHRVKVNIERIYVYEEGVLTIQTLYTGGDLEDKLGISEVKKKHEFLVEAEELIGHCNQVRLSEEEAIRLLEGKIIEKDVGSKVTVLTTADDPPHWWESYPYPQWTWVQTNSVYEISGPINLTWENTTQSRVKMTLRKLDRENNWVDDGALESIGAIREFVYQKHKGWTLGDNYATDSLGILGREHMRLWTIHTGAVVAAAHEDSPIPHEAISFEREENRIRDIFDGSPDWNLDHEEWLDNVVSDPSNPPYSNGYASVIFCYLVNNPPNVPSNPSPANHATGVALPVTLSVVVTDPDDDALTVTFFDASDDSVIGTDANVASGSRTRVTWPGLAADTTYSWYARANDGEFSTLSDTWSFSTAPANNPPNTPSMPSGPSSGYTGIPYSYSASSTDPDGDQVKYTFDWGDGTTSETGFVDSGTTASESHSWSNPGTYYVKAKATDSKGASSGWSDSKALTIVILHHLNPDFEAFPRKGTAPLEVRFENWTDGGERPYVKAEWDFDGDGAIETTLTGTHEEVMADVTWTYSFPGVYSVCLTMTDSFPQPVGPLVDSFEKSAYITVLFAPWVYDENKNGEIEKMEAIAAVQDYFSGKITKAQVIEVIMLYFG